MSKLFYESDVALEQYLLFHYGTPKQICPLWPEMQRFCDFPSRCVQVLDEEKLEPKNRALDLGCAVGRSSLELTSYFEEVVGLDFSHRFIEWAQRMQTQREAQIYLHDEGELEQKITIHAPDHLGIKNPVKFQQGDAGALDPALGVFDYVLMANLIDRLPDPQKCLASIHPFIAPEGLLVITSPYTWLEEYTPREKWLGDSRGTAAALKEILEPHFLLGGSRNIPFLIREHRRKFQWSIAHVTVWRRK